MAIAPGQTAKGVGASSATTNAVNTTTSGASFFVLVYWYSNSGANNFSSVGDNKSNSYTQVGTELVGTSIKARLYYVENGAGGTGHTFNGAQTGVGGITVLAQEVTGGIVSGILDQSVGVLDTTSPFASGSITTTQADELLLAFLASDSASNPATHAINSVSGTAPATGWTINIEETDGSVNWPGAIAAQVVSATGTYQGAWTESGAGQGAVWTISLKADTGGTQFSRPGADITVDNWTTDTGGATNLYLSIDETAASDADYIRSQLTPSSDVYVCSLGNVTDPAVSTGHIGRLRYGKDVADGDTLSLLAQLRQGYTNEGSPGTLIATLLNNANIGSGWTQADVTLSGAEADSISDYTSLFLRFVAHTEVAGGIQYVGSQGGSFAGKTGATTVTFALTGGLASVPAANDLVIVSYSVGSTADRALTIRNASAVDYTLAGAELYQNDTYDSNLRVGYRVMPGTPETTCVLSGTGSTADAGAYTIHVFRGVDTTTPLDVAAVTAGGINTRLANPGAITPTTTGAWIYVTGAAACATGGNFTAGYLSGFVAQTRIDTNDANVGAGYYSGWTSGAYDPAAFAGGGTDTVNDSWNAVTLALRPAATTRRAQVSWAEFQVPAAGGPSRSAGRFLLLGVGH